MRGTGEGEARAPAAEEGDRDAQRSAYSCAAVERRSCRARGTSALGRARRLEREEEGTHHTEERRDHEDEARQDEPLDVALRIRPREASARLGEA